MTKIQFLLSLHHKLADLPQNDVEEHLRFYSEMIEDRMEDGLSEEDAVAAIGSVDEITAQITADISHVGVIKTSQRRRPLVSWEILLLILGAPLWFALLIAAFAIVFSLFASLWAVIVSLWAVFVSLIGSAVGVVLVGVGFVIGGHSPSGLAMIGGSLVCMGLSLLMFLGCKAATKGAALLTRKIFECIANSLRKKEAA